MLHGHNDVIRQDTNISKDRMRGEKKSSFHDIQDVHMMQFPVEHLTRGVFRQQAKSGFTI